MNKRFIKRTWILICALLVFSSTAFSQFDDVDFLRAGATDGLTYIKAYVSPWTNAFGAGLNGGWYNSAKPHKLGGFDITAGINAGFVPSSATTFDVSQIGLTTLTGTGTASTVAGPDVEGPTLTASEAGITLASFRTPPGSDWKIIPVPTLQAGIGLPLGTELKVRYLPKINIHSGDVSLWGVGVMHSILQYLPGNKLLPFDVSLFGGYTKLTGNIPIDLQPEVGAPTNYSQYNPSTSFQDQNMKATVSAMNVGVIASLNIPVLTVYGGLGYAKTTTEIKLTGNYPLPTVDPAISTTQAVYEDAGVMKGFSALKVKDFSGLRANIGLRVKFAFITIHADYTRAHYNVVSTGLGVSFR